MLNNKLVFVVALIAITLGWSGMVQANGPSVDPFVKAYLGNITVTDAEVCEPSTTAAFKVGTATFKVNQAKCQTTYFIPITFSSNTVPTIRKFFVGRCNVPFSEQWVVNEIAAGAGTPFSEVKLGGVYANQTYIRQWAELTLFQGVNPGISLAYNLVIVANGIGSSPVSGFVSTEYSPLGVYTCDNCVPSTLKTCSTPTTSTTVSSSTVSSSISTQTLTTTSTASTGTLTTSGSVSLSSSMVTSTSGTVTPTSVTSVTTSTSTDTMTSSFSPTTTTSTTGTGMSTTGTSTTGTSTTGTSTTGTSATSTITITTGTSATSTITSTSGTSATSTITSTKGTMTSTTGTITSTGTDTVSPTSTSIPTSSTLPGGECDPEVPNQFELTGPIVYNVNRESCITTYSYRFKINETAIPLYLGKWTLFRCSIPRSDAWLYDTFVSGSGTKFQLATVGGQVQDTTLLTEYAMLQLYEQYWAVTNPDYTLEIKVNGIGGDPVDGMIRGQHIGDLPCVECVPPQAVPCGGPSSTVTSTITPSPTSPTATQTTQTAVNTSGAARVNYFAFTILMSALMVVMFM
eukprot:Nk52_evm31s343 gene=Nk52_evmTU31s343